MQKAKETPERLISRIFTPEIKAKADALAAKYETRRASILEILRLLQEHHGHITTEAEEAVAQYLELPAIDVREVMTFYSLFYRGPKAKTRFHVCRTLACSLLGGREILRHMEQRLGIEAGRETPDGKFSLETVECLGACEIAPMLQLNDKAFIGPLTKEKADELIEKGENL